MPRNIVLIGLILLLNGCATVPEPLRGDYPQAITPATIQARPEAYLGQSVRWGGVILGTENLPQGSIVEILAYPLDSSARPLVDEPNQGRFLLRMKAFVDPAGFEARREVSVIGRIEGTQTRKIGEFPYRYPVVEGQALYLWAPRQPARPDYYDPWYPWHAPYPYPYYR
jgi:outer membrane lipoprotein